MKCELGVFSEHSV